ncbi:MAG: DUF445 family protein [Treponema sp.]|nr:DUF445 family protein [Treponema sp.]
MNLNTILLFVVPPVAGAIIAYSTNVIAIRMLFRPLYEKRVFGIRVPFTPGVLPRQRDKLAVSIGSMVERELITAEVLRKRLADFDINGLSKIVTRFLRRDDIRKELEHKGRLIFKGILLKFNSFQRFFVSAGQYEQTLDEKMPEIINDLINSVEQLFQDEKVKKKLLSAVDGQVENILTSIDIKKLVSERIDSLDMLRVEKIILDIMSNQFKWIYFFGGVLGFLIGLFQAALTYFLR